MGLPAALCRSILDWITTNIICHYEPLGSTFVKVQMCHVLETHPRHNVTCAFWLRLGFGWEEQTRVKSQAKTGRHNFHFSFIARTEVDHTPLLHQRIVGGGGGCHCVGGWDLPSVQAYPNCPGNTWPIPPERKREDGWNLSTSKKGRSSLFHAMYPRAPRCISQGSRNVPKTCNLNAAGGFWSSSAALPAMTVSFKCLEQAPVRRSHSVGCIFLTIILPGFETLDLEICDYLVCFEYNLCLKSMFASKFIMRLN